MMIDLKSRDRIFQERKLKQIAESLKQSVDIRDQLKPLENFSTKELEQKFSKTGSKLDNQAILLVYVIGLLKKQTDEIIKGFSMLEKSIGKLKKLT